ncbi:hypothetical protein HFO56_34085 [Rhizobium laguerreae]|uniref:hypothetical protein n=1 Tax=Rhizobium laguerreae TaxID=1076926 RepID=UPI001C9046CF|nr:hypothetical protein [Rhizobium laguerreae]MBY3157357.1 hypothetical protein [Rhizobium laguerreae]
MSAGIHKLIFGIDKLWRCFRLQMARHGFKVLQFWEFHMRLSVPYILLARCEDGDFRLLDETEIDIPEVSGSEAPKAASYCDLTTRELLMRTTRVYQGRFFAPAIAEDGKAVPLSAAVIERKPEGSKPPSDLILYLELNGGHGTGPLGDALRIDLAGWYSKPDQPPKYFMTARSVAKYEPINEGRP